MILLHFISIAYLYSLYPLANSEDNACTLYLIPSTLPNAGRGVVAGRGFTKDSAIHDCSIIQVPKSVSLETSLMNYVYASEHEDYDTLMIGPGSIYNHFEPRTVHYTWASYDVADPSAIDLPYANLTDNTFWATEGILLGEEMLNNYGEEWFDRFSTGDDENVDSESQVPPRAISDKDLAEFGHCFTQVAITDSTIPGAGKGVFARRDFAVGDTVIVSPVLALPKNVIEDAHNNSVLQNYCIHSPESKLVFLPISYGALVNHHSSGANVRLEWYDWSAAEAAIAERYPTVRTTPSTPRPANLSAKTPATMPLQHKLAMTVEELQKTHFAPLDFAYIATRPITAGEEIFLNYGHGWQRAWEEYTDKLQQWQENKGVTGMEKPVFRHFIEAPEGLFSAQWYDPFPQCPIPA